MGMIKKQFSKELKAKVALEAMKGIKTTAEISSVFGVHPTQIMKWKSVVREKLPELFEGKRSFEEKGKEELIEELYKQIGQLQVENGWIKKKLTL